MFQKFFRKRPLPLNVVVENLQFFLKLYKEYGFTELANRFDELFNNTCKKYYLTREELYNKVLEKENGKQI